MTVHLMWMKLVVLFLGISVPVTTNAVARETSVSGGVDVGFEVYDKTSAANTVTSGQDESYQRMSVTPDVKIASESSRASYSAEYHPTLTYDDEGEEDINQAFSVSTTWVVTQRWQLNFANTYVETDNSSTTFQPITQSLTSSAGENQLTETPGRHQYATNQFKAEAKHTYWEDSLVKFGYMLSTLRNKDDDQTYQDYDKHDLFADIQHRISSDYKMSTNLNYILGRYGESVTAEDQLVSGNSAVGGDTDTFEEHLDTTLEILKIPHQPLSIQYSLAAYQFDSGLKNAAEIHTLLFGWGWDVSSHLKLFVGAGPTLQHVENNRDQWDYAVRSSLTYAMERSNIGLFFDRSSEVRNFTATSDNGLTEFWTGRAQYSYTMLSNLSLSLSAAYSHDTVENGQLDTLAAEAEEDLVKKRSSISGGLHYTFWEQYSADLQYSFVHQEANRFEDEYDEQRVLLTLAYRKEFLRW